MNDRSNHVRGLSLTVIAGGVALAVIRPQPAGATPDDPPTTACVSVSAAGAQANDASAYPSISAEGRFVAFEGSAGNLVSELRPEGTTWIYLRDLTNGLTTRVVAASAEATSDGGTVSAALSADGRWLAFASAGSALVAGDTNAVEDVFVRGPLH